jgi:hypothetical protein
MASLTHSISHHFHGAVRCEVFENELRAPMFRLYPAGKSPISHGVAIFMHDLPPLQIAAFKALAAALAAQDVPVKEEV